MLDFLKKPKINYSVIDSKEKLTKELINELFKIRVKGDKTTSSEFLNFNLQEVFKKKYPRLFLIYKDKKLTGYILGDISKKNKIKNFDIKYFYISKPENKKGLGTKLYARMLAYLRSKDKVKNITSISYTDNSRKIAQYLGFQKIKSKNKIFKRNNKSQIDYKFNNEFAFPKTKVFTKKSPRK